MEQNTVRAQNLAAVKMRLRQISEKAKQDKNLQFTSLAHLLTVELLEEAFNELPKNASPGVDGITHKEYGVNLRENLERLHQRLREKTYRAKPARRVFIEKENGKLRPIGIPSIEDKVAQKAVVYVLAAIYEQDFLSCSYGFRPGRNQHQALDAIYQMVTHGKVSFVVDADVTSYFDTVVHSEMMNFLRRRIADASILRLITKWLRSGVLEDGTLLLSAQGTPQGAVISPLLANLYLHYVLDTWVYEVVKPLLRGEVHLVRYADDFVVGFQHQQDAERFWRVLPKRFARYGLELSQEKSHLLPFGRFAEERLARYGEKPPTFNFLGFTHICGRNSKTGKFALHVQTMSKRLRRSLSNIADWCKTNRHLPISTQHELLCQKVLGHYGYYGRRTNMPTLKRYFASVKRLWGSWLRRRAQRRHLTWNDFYYRLLPRYPLPAPKIMQLGYQEVRQLELCFT